MSRKDEIDKVLALISDKHEGRYTEGLAIAEYLVDNNIRSKDGFEIEAWGVATGQFTDGLEDYDTLRTVKPRDYKE